ncbi:MAG TPA: hypothetical protein VN027_00520 [Isoptericola sp.]|nr:hypothetical protein [Isoptericola sp.]
MVVGAEPAPHPGRRRTRRWVALAVIAVVGAGATAGAAALAPPRQTADVPVPPADASPEQVVRAYLEAVSAHDCETAAALSAAGDAGDHLCGATRSLEIIEVVPAPQLSGPTTAAVNTDFEVAWRPFAEGGDVPEEGWGWTYYLALGPEGWRIVDAGAG